LSAENNTLLGGIICRSRGKRERGKGERGKRGIFAFCLLPSAFPVPLLSDK